MRVFEWIEKELQPTGCDSTAFMYDEMASQSDYCLPLIYQPFDVHKRAHWRDRGFCFDYLHTTHGEGKQLLDFGPGDGWPSLIVAPFAKEVVGVDGSQRRIQICSENAERMGLKNAKFIYVKPGKNLPFDNDTLDGAMAASSIEQTPDPESTLQELYRVLKPEGRLRINYESLGYYRNGKEQEIFLGSHHTGGSVLTLYNRCIEEEKAYMYKIFLSGKCENMKDHIASGSMPLTIDQLTIGKLKVLLPFVTEARMCTLTHPSGNTLIHWLQEIGFSEVRATHNGGWFAGELFDSMPTEGRPGNLEAIDELLRPLVSIVVRMKAPVGVPNSWDPMITAIK